MRKNLSGKKYGNLYVSEEWRKKGKHTQWLCKCSCGKDSWFYSTNLIEGRSEGCKYCKIKKTIKHLSGHKMGDWTLTDKRTMILSNAYVWAVCKCGTEKWVFVGNLISKRSRGCVSCYRRRNEPKQKRARERSR